MIEIRSYGKSELALMYFPNSATPHVATNRLTSWIRRCKPLYEAILECHSSKDSRFYTPKEVIQIIHYLGDP